MMDHLTMAKEILENVCPAPDGPVAEWFLEAQAHALVALVDRLDKLTACVEPDSRLFRTKPFDIR